MGVAVSLLLAAAGLVLAIAVHPTHPGSVDVNTVGWILFIVGLVGFILDVVLWSEMGPGYMRRRYTTTGAAPVRRYGYGPRRTIVEEEDVPGPPPPGY